MLGRAVLAEQVALDDVFYLEGAGRAGSFDFTTARLTPTLTLDELRGMQRPVVVYVSEHGREAVMAAGLQATVLAHSPDFRVTRLNARFLDPRRRDEVLSSAYLLKVGE
ncbi:hypothetical protein SDC9_206339 [bioreactor metagenome]|uniref:Uncharacterized protein n=1 Tax=bioreactor metagenome TaxID=1076179 RepID=A0A645J685_9ZZZZ